MKYGTGAVSLAASALLVGAAGAALADAGPDTASSVRAGRAAQALAGDPLDIGARLDPSAVSAGDGQRIRAAVKRPGPPAYVALRAQGVYAKGRPADPDDGRLSAHDWGRVAAGVPLGVLVGWTILQPLVRLLLRLVRRRPAPPTRAVRRARAALDAQLDRVRL